jgi:hypothetical protein
MCEYSDYAYNRAREGLIGINEEIAADIYAVSFYYWFENADGRRARLSVGYNTNSRWRACTPAPGQQPNWSIAWDSDEAKWNYAFWLQDKGEACDIGAACADASARQTWIESLGLWWTDKQEEEDFDATMKLGGKIEEHFIRLCIAVAKRLHDDGVIEKKFGRPVPILIHELEYYNGIAEATRQANPPGLAAEFEKWICGVDREDVKDD